MLIAIIGAFLVAISLTTFAVSSLRGWSRDRAAPLFGVVVLLYGVRLLGRSPLVWEVSGLTGTWFRFADAWITCAILAPATMFVEVIAASPYRIIARRLWQIDLIYAALAIGADIAVRRPGSVLWINPIAVILHFSLGAVLLIGSFRINRHKGSPRQAPTARRGMITAMIGLGIFAVFATYETIFRDPTRRALAYASAGHPPILLLRASGEIESLEEGGLVLAFNPDASYSNVSIPMDPGDRLLLYTDGLLETADPSGTFFGDARLFKSLRDAASLNLTTSLAHLISDLNSWRGPNAPLTDDVTLVTVELRVDILSDARQQALSVQAKNFQRCVDFGFRHSIQS